MITESEARALAAGKHPDPFRVLGPSEDGLVVLIPGAQKVWAVNSTDQSELTQLWGDLPVFSGQLLPYYKLRIQWVSGWVDEREDPYRFSPVLGAVDEYLVGEGRHESLWTTLGSHPMTHEGVQGVHFAVWAPNARRVSVVGAFNHWNGIAHPMRPRGSSGIWELFIPGLGEGEIYKYEILGAHDQVLPLKADPVAIGAQLPPETASVVRSLGHYKWSDEQWLATRSQAQALDAPVSIYEVHLESWRKEGWQNLIDYVADLGFTHIEVLPITEHPFGGSWGYQPVGMYAPTSRLGTPEDFQAFVDCAHQRGLGVLADWVPGHFPTDAHGLGEFDGTALYEHQNPQEGFHPDWNTLIYNYGRPEVAGHLRSNALYWLQEYHLDGLRVDAVASIIHRDYSREPGQWVPNKDGGNENYEAIDFIQSTNDAIARTVEGAMMVAEESTTFPGVTRETQHGGLGFDYKWNMGWMNDSLKYFGLDPIYRKHHSNLLTFGFTYLFSERFMLPISHDEVVHGKGSLYGRMPGDHAAKLGNLKAFLAYMWAYPGKKLLFMGQEFGQPREWDYRGELQWDILTDPGHAGVLELVRDLNALYRNQPALHRREMTPEGFQWLLVDSIDEQVYAWLRRGALGDPHIVVVMNLTPVEREGFRVPFPLAGRWVEALNTDSSHYHGGNRGHDGAIETEPVPMSNEAQSALLTLPPLSVIYFVEDQS
ncbi:1,4-alpha-glucan branching protein GlgB [Rothia sp. ZJ1223]|uniref:1,4-alpha-glucan branching protein GlgB n=1 Tax=Rothia sp. ZJ1223 TaxID=2811098 RepID=UPI00195717E6|nr:1,4-alpha-glucan branching protein GlgB [Rothia sp. ZJ1223]MBM7050740.1 1,4-alpha-glucan branching protein GlgB [Rothia sp. ZJ1223]